MAHLLEVEDLKVHFPVRRGVLSRTSGYVHAVDGISLHVAGGRAALHAALTAPLGHQLQIGRVVLITEKRLLPAIPTLRSWPGSTRASARTLCTATRTADFAS